MSPVMNGAVVVFDTSTLVGACISRDGNPARALAWALASQVVAASAETLAELKTVLTRPKLEKFRSPDLRMAFYEAYAGAVRLHSVTASTLDCRDPKDNKFLDLVLQAGAKVLISSDDDLLVLHPWRGAAVLTPLEFLQALVV